MNEHMIDAAREHTYNVDFIDPLSKRVVYECAVDARDVGDAYTRASLWAMRRGINVNACSHRMTRIM